MENPGFRHLMLWTHIFEFARSWLNTPDARITGRDVATFLATKSHGLRFVLGLTFRGCGRPVSRDLNLTTQDASIRLLLLPGCEATNALLQHSPSRETGGWKKNKQAICGACVISLPAGRDLVEVRWSHWRQASLAASLCEDEHVRAIPF